MKLREAVQLFLGEYKPTTRKSYNGILAPMLEYIGNRPVTDIIPPDLLRYVQSIRERPTVKSSATVNGHIKTIKCFFNWCVRYQIIATSPAAPLRRDSQKKAVSRDKAITEAELRKLLDYARWHVRTYALILFLADTGARRGGLAGLQWSDLNLVERTGRVTEKGEKNRPVFFGGETALALNNWRLEQERTNGDYVFSQDGSKLKPVAVAQIVRRASKRAKIRSIGTHAFRHRKGHQLADAKVAPTVAATILGHDNVETTLNYYYPKDYDRAEAEARQLFVKPDAQDKVIEIRKRIQKPS